jgi:glucose/arabinose dehydrogenase
MDGEAVTRHRTARSLLAAVALAVSALTGAPPSRAQAPIEVLPAQFAIQNVAAGLTKPTGIDFLPDGRILLAEQAGVVKLITLGSSKHRVALDIQQEVSAALERGLTDVTVDPDFANNGYVYLLYTYDKPGQEPDGVDLRLGRLVRYTMSEDVIDPQSARVLVDGFESDVAYHATGSVRVSPAGEIYASFGDSSNPYEPSDLSLRSQALTQLQGKIVRVDREGKALPGNPFYDAAQPKSVRSMVWAYGLRNPFRFALHPSSAVPYVGNVGQSTSETLVRATAGANFGWPCYEGAEPYAPFTGRPECEGLAGKPPAIDYSYTHDGDNASIIGGDFPPFGNFPDALQGSYFFADYNRQFIRRAVLDAGGKVTRVEPFIEFAGFLADVQFSPSGRMYALDYIGGTLRQVTFEPDRSPPVARLDASLPSGASGSISGVAPLTVMLSAARSTDADLASGNEKLIYWWNLAAGALNQDSGLLVTDTPTLTHVFDRAGTYTVRVTAVDALGWQSSAETRVVVRDATPRAEVTSTSNGDTYPVGARVIVRGRGFDTAGAALTPDKLSWTVDFMDAGSRRRLAAGSGDVVSFVMPASAPDPSLRGLQESGRALVTLRAADSAGVTGSTTIRLYPQPRDGYVRSWWLIGGFPGRALFNDALPGGEAAFRLSGDVSGLRAIHSPSRRINLAQLISPAENTMAYAFVWLYAPDEREALLGMNSDDGIAVWLNGEEVWRNKTNRFVSDDTRDYDLLRVLKTSGSVMRDVMVRTKAVLP